MVVIREYLEWLVKPTPESIYSMYSINKACTIASYVLYCITGKYKKMALFLFPSHKVILKPVSLYVSLGRTWNPAATISSIEFTIYFLPPASLAELRVNYKYWVQMKGSPILSVAAAWFWNCRVILTMSSSSSSAMSPLQHPLHKD